MTDNPDTDNSSTSSTQDPGPPPDPRPALNRSLRTAAQVMSRLEAANAGAPSPCPGWTALDVARHLVAVADRITAVGEQRDPNPLPVMAEGVEVADIATAFDAAAERTRAAWADPSVLGALVTVPWGQVPGAVAAAIYSAEVLVHTWDLARALGVEPEWTAEDVETALRNTMTGIPAEPRGGEIPFGPPTDVAPDAPTADRLAAWMGRSV